MWKGVAELLANGVESLHPWRVGERGGRCDRHRASASRARAAEISKVDAERDGARLALVIPCWNSVLMFLGALIAYIWTKYRADTASVTSHRFASGYHRRRESPRRRRRAPCRLAATSTSVEKKKRSDAARSDVTDRTPTSGRGCSGGRCSQPSFFLSGPSGTRRPSLIPAVPKRFRALQP